jgi:hypothetical protein
MLSIGRGMSFEGSPRVKKFQREAEGVLARVGRYFAAPEQAERAGGGVRTIAPAGRI